MVSPVAQVSDGMGELIGGEYLLLREIVRSSVWESVEEKCRNDVGRVLDGLRNKEWWSYQVVDASTKIPNSLLVGNWIDLGNYDECLQIQFPKSETTGQHCLAHFGLNLSQADNSLQVQPSFTWSYCIPSTCRAENLGHVLNTTWFQLTGSSVSVSPNECHVQGESSWTTEGIFGVAFCAFFLLLCVASTVYDTWPKRSKSSFYALLCSFSLYTNGKRLITVGERAEIMKCLDGMRFLTICWVILGHNYFYLTVSPIINAGEMSKMIGSLSFELLCGAVLAVDTFFLLSGLLNAYYLFKILDKTKSFPLFKFYIHRYIRTTPALAAVVLIYATWFAKIGDGPLWHQMTDQSQLFCQKYWWSTILYISNYYNPVEQCAGQSWFLAVDTQLFWLSPLVIIPCWRWPKISKFYLTFLLFISCAIQFAVAYIDKFRASFSFTQDSMEEYVRTSHYMYTPTHMRFTPYIMGIMLGMFLHHLRKSNRNLSLTKMTVFTGWVVSTVLCLSVVLGMYPFMQPLSDHPYNRLESTFYISLHRVAWCIGLSWIIVACLQGYGGIVNSLLSWDGFVPLSRLTYCIYLTHMAIQQYLVGTMRTNGHFSDFRQVHAYFGDVVMAIFASCVLSLCFESPVQMIEKYVWQPKKTNNLAMGKVNATFVEDQADEKVAA